MLLFGPPQIRTLFTLPVPLTLRAPLLVGCKTKIGIGDMLVTIAAVAWAATFLVLPPTSAVSVVGTGRATVTRSRGTGSLTAFESETPGSRLNAFTWLQKST